MKINRYINLTQAISDLKKKGYSHSFKFSESKGLQCIENDTFYDAHDLKIAEYHRFKENSSLADISILFVLEANDGIKGTMISSYGVYYDLQLMEFMNKIKIKLRLNNSDRSRY